MWISLNIPLRTRVDFDIMNMFSVVDTLIFQQNYQQAVDIFVNKVPALCINFSDSFCIMWIDPTRFLNILHQRGFSHTGYLFEGVNTLWKAILMSSGTRYFQYCKKG